MACDFNKDAVWGLTPKYKPVPFLESDRGHVQAYLITLYGDGRQKSVIPQETSFKSFAQKALPKSFYEWYAKEGIWKEYDKVDQPSRSKERLQLLNAPINCGGRCMLCNFVAFKSGDRAKFFCCDTGLFLHHATSVSDPEEGDLFGRN